MNEYPQRRKNRLNCINYNENGAYFITICTKERACMLWNPDADFRHPAESLNACGQAIAREIDRIENIYEGMITVDNYVIMPNHVHLLIAVHPENAGGRHNTAPAIPSVINQFKGSVTKRLGFPLWQKSFHDHVVRNEQEYRLIWEYIDRNPGKWEEDRYYTNPS